MAIVADLSVYSILKILARTNSYKQIIAYREHHGLCERIPDYQVKLGFGLHVGWSIEGLIGSDFKIDASYLSPHVNISMRLEEANKTYGVPFVLSQDIYNILSKPYKALCRPLDHAILKGTGMKLKLYTVEMDLQWLELCDDILHGMTTKKRTRLVNDEKSILF